MSAALSQERRWWLSQFERGGWTLGRPIDASKAKWKEHGRQLVKAGLLEGDGTLFRITDDGLAALGKSTP